LKIKWFKNNNQINPSERISIQYNSTMGVTALKILNPDSNDAGVYKVVGQNKAGNAESQTTVSLPKLNLKKNVAGEIGPLKNEYPIVQDAVREPLNEETFETPKFTVNLPAKCKLNEGEPIILTCEVDGKPKPLVIFLGNCDCYLLFVDFFG
jgi:hypothetical protein